MNIWCRFRWHEWAKVYRIWDAQPTLVCARCGAEKPAEATESAPKGLGGPTHGYPTGYRPPGLIRPVCVSCLEPMVLSADHMYWHCPHDPEALDSASDLC